MLLIHMVIAILLSLMTCMALYPLCSIRKSKGSFVSTGAIGQLLAVTLSTLASIALIRWIMMNSLLTVALLQLATAFYLAHLACTKTLPPSQQLIIAFNTPRRFLVAMLRTLLLAPAGLLPLGILSLFISDRHVNFQQLLAIGFAYSATVSAYYLISCWLGGVNSSERRKNSYKLWRTGSRGILFIISAYIVWQSFRHFY